MNPDTNQKVKRSKWFWLGFIIISGILLQIGHSANPGIPGLVTLGIYLVLAFFGWLGIIGMYYCAREYGDRWPVGAIAFPFAIYAIFLLSNISEWGDPVYLRNWFVIGPIIIITIWLAFMAILSNEGVWPKEY